MRPDPRFVALRLRSARPDDSALLWASPVGVVLVAAQVGWAAAVAALALSCVGLIAWALRPRRLDSGVAARWAESEGRVVFRTNLGEVAVPRGASAHLAEGREGTERRGVEIRSPAGAVEMQVLCGSEAEALALLAWLDADLAREPWAARLGRPTLAAALLLGACAAGVLLGAARWGAGGALAGLGLGALAAAAFAAYALPPSLEVGVDGVRVTWRRQTRFWPWSEIKRATVDARSVTLHLRRRRTVRLPAARLSAPALEALRKRLTLGKRAYRPEQLGPAVLLPRPGESAREWLERVRAAARSGYREPGTEPALLRRLVAKPGAPPLQRMGAAVALGLDDPEVREALQGAGAAVVEPRVRVALASLARGEPDEAVLEALLASEAARRELRAPAR